MLPPKITRTSPHKCILPGISSHVRWSFVAKGRATGMRQAGRMSATYYDLLGNPVQQSGYNQFGYVDHVFTAYNFDRTPLSVERRHRRSESQSVTELYSYTYDALGRETKVTHSINGATARTISESEYNSLRQLSKRTAGSVAVSYGYGLGGALNSISSEPFTQRISRETPACASGLVTSVTQKFGSGPSTTTYYEYDNLGRLVQAKEGGTARSGFAYNLNGCPTAISRFGVADREGGEAVYGDIDRAAFAYDGNQLVSSTDAAVYLSYAGANDLPNGESEYAYDANGNMALDTGRGIDEVKYNRLNLPTRIDCSDGSVVTFEYDELGAKLAETDSIPVSFIIRPLGGFEPLPGTLKPLCNVTRTEYCGSCVYVDGKLKRLLFPGGYATPKAMGGGYNYHYYVTDYLGSVRAVVAEDGAVEETNSYYPYGMQMPDETGAIQQTQPYKYGGKERLTAAGVNLYDFGPRALYSPAAQFTSLDPKCEDYPHLSPYLYCAANPVNFIDPTGEELWLCGSWMEIVKAIQIYHEGMGNNVGLYVYFDKNPQKDGKLIGKVNFKKGNIQESIDKLSDTETAYYENLNTIISDGEKTVLNLCSSSESCLIGDIDNAMVDLDDLQTFESMVGNGWFTASGGLMHETYEQYQVQARKNSEQWSAHTAACGVEAHVSNYFIHPIRELSTPYITSEPYNIHDDVGRFTVFGSDDTGTPMGYIIFGYYKAAFTWVRISKNR